MANDSRQELGIAAESPPLEAFGYRQELKRSLGLRHLITYGLVMISPISPIAVFGFVFNASHGMVPLVYGVGLVAMLFTAWSYATMSRAFPVAGSVYAYAGRSLGPAAGFIAGWAILLDYLLVPALMYLISAVALAAVIPAVPKWVWLALLLGGNATANLFGIENTTRVGMAMLALQLTFLAVFMVIAGNGVIHGVAGAHVALTPLFNAATFAPGAVFGALSIAALSFLGFDAVSTLAEEAKGGGPMVGRATLLSLGVAALLFVVQTYVISLFLLGKTVLPAGDATDQASYDVAAMLGGLGLKAMVSVIGGVLGNAPSALTAQAAVSRLLFGMARDGRLPRALAHVNPRRKVPARAILLVAGLTVVLMAVFDDRIDTLASMVNFGALTGFLFVHLSVIAHFTIRQRSTAWGRHLLAPLAGFAIIAYVLWNMGRPAQIAGLAWLAIGIIVMLAVKRREGKVAAGVATDSSVLRQET